jgi:hypothetical protein
MTQNSEAALPTDPEKFINTRERLTNRPKRTAVVAKALTFVSLVPILTACGTVLDPAPFRPAALVSQQKGLPAFPRLDEAASGLMALSDQYAEQTDTIARQRIGFDALMIGLPIATGANAAFHGTKDVTTGLGLGTAAVGGINAYFSPQLKVTAYNAASTSLSCASSFASELSVLATDNQTWIPQGLSGNPAEGGQFRELTRDIQYADTAVMFGTVNVENVGNVAVTITSDQKTSLVNLSNTAKKTYADLMSSFQSVDATPSTLDTFASMVITTTSSKIITGSQNVTAALQIIQGNGTAPPAPTNAPTTSSSGQGVNASHATGAKKLTPAQTAAANAAAAKNTLNKVMNELPGLTTQGEAAAAAINAKIAAYTSGSQSCALPKS